MLDLALAQVYKQLGPALAYASSLNDWDKKQVMNANGHINLRELRAMVDSFSIGLGLSEYEAYGYSEEGGNGIAGLHKPKAFFNVTSYKKAMQVGAITVGRG